MLEKRLFKNVSVSCIDMKRVLVALLFCIALIATSAAYAEDYVISEKTWQKLPLDEGKTYYIGGYVKSAKTYTFFLLEMNKGTESFTVLCKQSIDAKKTSDSDVVCYEKILAMNQVLTQKTGNMFFIVATLEQEQEATVVEKKLSSKIYYYGASLVATKQNNVVTYYHADYLDSIRMETNNQSEVIAAQHNAPFGEDIYVSSFASAENAYKFTGQESDETLYYYGARYYNPASGRFTQPDPLTSMDVYNYANNNPLRYVDPDGRYAIDKNSFKIVANLKENDVIMFVETAKLLSAKANSALGYYDDNYPSILVDPLFSKYSRIDAKGTYNYEEKSGIPFLTRLFNHGNEGKIKLSDVNTFDGMATLIHEAVHRLQHMENREVSSTPNVQTALFDRYNGYFYTKNINQLLSLTPDEIDIAKKVIDNEIEAQTEAYDALLRAQQNNQNAYPGLKDALKENKLALQKYYEVRNTLGLIMPVVTVTGKKGVI